MKPIQILLMILAVAAGTQLTRWLSFLIFPEKKEPPKLVTDLGKLLPAAMMGLLVVFCLKDVDWASGSHGAAELISIAVVVALHGIRRNVLLSIAGGTIAYMILVQSVFV